jgi:hypothetical protein
MDEEITILSYLAAGSGKVGAALSKVLARSATSTPSLPTDIVTWEFFK